MSEKEKTINLFLEKNQADCNIDNWRKSLADKDDFQYFINKAVAYGWDSASRIIKFLCGPHAGMSSEAICLQSVSDTVILNAEHPYDRGDFMRCQICLKETGIDIQIMKGVSPVWDALVENWDRLTDQYRAERNGGPGPVLYNLIREIIDSVKEGKKG